MCHQKEEYEQRPKDKSEFGRTEGQEDQGGLHLCAPQGTKVGDEWERQAGQLM